MSEATEKIIIPIFEKLIYSIKTIEQHFLSKYLGKDITDQTIYNLDVRAYCLLVHASFEEYFENIALTILDNSIDNYLKSKTINDCLLSLIHFKCNQGKVNETIPLKTFDYMRDRFADAKTSLSKEITMLNHGISLEHLNKLFYPLAIDIDDDPRLTYSLGRLWKERGAYAHKGTNTIQKILSPKEAIEIVEDVTKLASILNNSALEKMKQFNKDVELAPRRMLPSPQVI